MIPSSRLAVTRRPMARRSVTKVPGVEREDKGKPEPLPLTLLRHLGLRVHLVSGSIILSVFALLWPLRIEYVQTRLIALRN